MAQFSNSMNISDKIYQNKLSIYDLLVAKYRNKSRSEKENLRKQLTSKLSDIESNDHEKVIKKKNIPIKINSQNNVKSQESVNDKLLDPVMKNDLKVILQGKSVRDRPNSPIENMNKSDDYLLIKLQESLLNSDEIAVESDSTHTAPKSLALITDLGTTQKYNFSKRPEKLIPISTLKPKIAKQSIQNLGARKSTRRTTSITNPFSEMEESNIENIVRFEEIEEDSRESLENNNFAEQRQRKRSKIRSVEEIISSLKSDDYMQSQLESDKRIDDLIKKVLNRMDDGETNSDEDQKLADAANQNKDEIEPNNQAIASNYEMEAETMLQELESNRSLAEIELTNENELDNEGGFQEPHLEKNETNMIQTKEDQRKIDELLIDLLKDTNVTNEDLVSIKGVSLPTKFPDNDRILIDDLNDSIRITKADVHKGIHELCMMQDYNAESIATLKKRWVEKYIPDKYPYHKEKIINEEIDPSAEDRIEKAAERIINQKEQIEKWREKAVEMLDKSSKIEVIGTFIAPEYPKIPDIWQPLSPKLRMTPNRARKMLCGEYNKNYPDSTVEEVSKQNTFENFSTNDLELSNENSFCDEMDLDALETKERLLSRRTNSCEHINAEDGMKPLVNPDSVRKRERCSSVPNRHWLEEDSLIVHLEYHQIMEEINIQKQHIRELKHVSSDIIDESDDELDQVKQEFVKIDVNEMIENTDEPVATNIQVKSTFEEYSSPAQKALEAGRNYVYYPPKKSKKTQKKYSVNISRITAIEKFLLRTPNTLQKTESFENISQKSRYIRSGKKKNPLKVMKSLSKSLGSLEQFENWSQRNGYKADKSARDWITVIWDLWFDEIYPPLPDIFVDITSNEVISTGINMKREITNQEIITLSNANNEILDLPEKIDPVLNEVEEEFRDQVIETLHEEIRNITEEIEKGKKPNAFLLSRRGAIYRKLGFLIGALTDLNDAISIEPDLLIAYWERHLLHLITNKIQPAIEDLNFILKKDKNYIAAYKSRAGIYASLGDVSLAISNLSQAIRLAPDDTDAFSKRAELYEQNGDSRLALEDYNQLIRFQPNNCLAMMKHGLYYLNIEQWQLAIKDFSNVLRHYPLNTDAWLYRGTALAKLNQWQDALTDFSAVIHLDPNNYLAYFKRGCLLRRAEPYLAIRDFSISLLLESSEENILSYLHRGILYAQTKQYSEAIVDFELVICFNKDMSCAHVDLGLVYFENGEYEKAVKYMTSGLAADPTYIRAYPCRAEAYFKMNKFQEAINDINRAIHIYPDRSNYYMLRGDFYLAIGKMEMAAICVRQAAEISHNLGQSPVQQALVHSFLQHYDQAIDALFQATRNRPSLSLLNLLGTTQMKAQRWKDAIVSFSICLEQMKPKSQFKPWPPGAANLYFMVAQCYLELKNYKQSQQAFSATVKINPNHSEAYYQQGWCRLRLGKMKQGILDLNKALAINPKLFQAYLARATFFGYKNQFTKAILNCNEVLAIEPRCLRAYLYRGVLKYKIKAYSLAVKDFTESLKIDPNCILAYFNRAICLNSEKQNYRKAIKDYSVVLMIEDTLQLHYKAYINRGLVYLETNDVQNALHDFIQAQSIQSDDVYVLYVVGLCHHKLKNLNEAIRIFSRCLDSDSKFILAKVSRGNVWMDYNHDRGREYAAKDYLSVLEINPNHLGALVNLGFCRQAQGKFKQAWDIFTAAIIAHPTSEKPLDGRAIVCLQMRDLNGALKDLNEAIRLQPQSSVLYTNRGVVYQLMRDAIRAMKDYNKAILIGGYQCQIALYNMGCVYLHNSQLQQAFDCFMKTLPYNPADEAVWMNLALVLIFQDKSEESIEYINKAISLTPYAAHLYFNRANVYCNMQRYEDAENDFSTCLKLAPDDAHVHKTRADCRSKLGDTAGALQDYKMSVYISSSFQRRRKL